MAVYLKDNLGDVRDPVMGLLPLADRLLFPFATPIPFPRFFPSPKTPFSPSPSQSWVARHGRW